jgi:hypothetical protein
MAGIWIIKIIKSGRIGWEGTAARMRDMRNG